MKRELIAPPDVRKARQAVELLRGWIIDGEPQYSLFPTIWNDDLPSWGRFLADTACHIANAIGEDTGRDSKDVLKAIAESFIHELKEPTGTHEGVFQSRQSTNRHKKSAKKSRSSNRRAR
jgi:hypothetical protein